MIPVIAVGFALLGGLLLWFVIGSRGPWWAKLTAIVATCAFTFAVWDALDSFSGWPTAQKPPDRALLLGSAVDEPKAIYVWLMAPATPGLLDYRQDGAEPRAYRLPYSRELHEQVDRGTSLVKKGELIELRRAASGRPGSDGRLAVQRYRLPATSVPRKASETTSEAPQP